MMEFLIQMFHSGLYSDKNAGANYQVIRSSTEMMREIAVQEIATSIIIVSLSHDGIFNPDVSQWAIQW